MKNSFYPTTSSWHTSDWLYALAAVPVGIAFWQYPLIHVLSEKLQWLIYGAAVLTSLLITAVIYLQGRVAHYRMAHEHLTQRLEKQSVALNKAVPVTMLSPLLINFLLCYGEQGARKST